MADEKVKKTISDILTDKLSAITDEVVKKMKEGDKPVEKKVEKKVDKVVEKIEKSEDNTDDKKDDEVVKQLNSLSELVKDMTKKLEKMENPDAELTKKKDEIIEKAIELAKDMGIDSEDINIEFKVVEKKKGEQDTDSKSQDEFIKKQNTDNSDDDLAKELDGATPEVKKAALEEYMKQIVR